jgi:hypothetical protein
MNEENNLNAVALETSSVGAITIAIKANTKVEVRITERDRRTMNHMDPETKAIHIRLEQWGAETRENLSGYPRVTLLGRLIEQGPMGASQTGKPPVSLSEPAARVDTCVGKLCQIDQRALKFYYQAQISREVLARKMSMRERQAQNVLRRARWRVQAHLAVMEG